MYYYESVKDDLEVELKLLELAQKLPTRMIPVYFKRIRSEELTWNHKRAKRVYKKLGLNLKRKVKRCLPDNERTPLLAPKETNVTWSMDLSQTQIS
jgi:putative transposase